MTQPNENERLARVEALIGRLGTESKTAHDEIKEICHRLTDEIKELKALIMNIKNVSDGKWSSLKTNVIVALVGVISVLFGVIGYFFHHATMGG